MLHISITVFRYWCNILLLSLLADRGRVGQEIHPRESRKVEEASKYYCCGLIRIGVYIELYLSHVFINYNKFSEICDYKFNR